MRVTKARRTAILTAGILLASCAQHRIASMNDPSSAETITFHNSGRERIQVYLVGQKDDWLLGRLEPMETAHLRLPEASAAPTDEAMALAIVPGWSRSLAPRSDRRATLSILEYRHALPGEEWSFVNGQLQGPRQRRSLEQP